MTVPVVEEEIPLAEIAGVTALVESEGAAQDLVADNLVAAILALWAGFREYYDGKLVQQFSERIGRLVVAAQQSAGQITEAHLRLQIGLMGLDLPRSTIVDMPDSIRLGAYPDEIYQRPIRQVRYLESVETPREVAVETARERLEKQALTDLQLARTIAAQQVLYRFPQATGWRRIIHPELGNVCGLCIAAADRVYGRIDKMDLHPGCKCTILPIVGSQDPGGRLNAADLSRLYAAAGSTATEKLRQIRVVTKENGELGPILMPDGSEYKGPQQAQRQLSPEAAERRKAQLQRQVDEMRNRRRLSEWHLARLGQLEDLLATA